MNTHVIRESRFASITWDMKSFVAHTIVYAVIQCAFVAQQTNTVRSQGWWWWWGEGGGWEFLAFGTGVLMSSNFSDPK